MDFENFNKKGCFLSFEREKTNFTTFCTPPAKFLKKSLSGPPGKNYSNAHGGMCRVIIAETKTKCTKLSAL